MPGEFEECVDSGQAYLGAPRTREGRRFYPMMASRSPFPDVALGDALAKHVSAPGAETAVDLLSVTRNVARGS